MSEATGGGPDPLNIFERFLMPGILPGEPLSLLGLASAAADEAEIKAALQRRLAILAAHPASTSAAGNEVRFALHAAAAKLLERVDRGGGEPQGPVVAAPDQEMEALARAMVLNGGWTAATLQQATVLAQARGVDVAEITRRVVGGGPRGGTQAVASRAAAPLNGPPRAPFGVTSVMEPPEGSAGVAEADPARRVILVGAWVVGGLFALLMAITAVIVVIARMPTPGPNPPNTATTPPAAPVDAPPATAAKPPATAPAASSASKPPAKHVEEWADLVRELDGCAPLLRSGDAGATARLEQVLKRMAARWPTATPDERSAAVNGVVEAIYAVKEEPDPCRALVRAIATPAVLLARSKVIPAEDVWAGVWSAGLLARLTSERDLPRAVVREIDDLAAEAFAAGGGTPAEASFEAGAAAVLTAVTSKLTPATPPDTDAAAQAVAEGWKNWLAACVALRGPGSELYQHLVLASLDRLTTASPEPTANQSVLDAITIVTAGLTWRESDASRRWLLRAFDSKAVTCADLFAVTSAIATRSGAPGVDQTMVLSATAQEAARAQLRDEYASVWGMASAEVHDQALTKWIAAARAELARQDVPASPIPNLVHGVIMARLNAAASLIWAGSPDEAAAILVDPDAGLANRLTTLTNAGQLNVLSLRGLNRVVSAGGGQSDPLARGLSPWALQYLPMFQTGGRITDRRKLLQDFHGPPNAADARIIVEEACGSGNDGIRADAQAIVKKFSGDATIVAALLAEAPSMPQTLSSTGLVSSVALAAIPAPRDSGWRVAVRRALIERLLELLAGKSDLGIVDDVSVVLAEAYAQQMPPPVNAPPKPDEDAPIPMRTPPAPEAAVTAVRARWLREAEAAVPTGKEPISLAQAASARAARARIAQGRIQAFAAAQADICELMAFVVTAERTSRAARAAAVLSDLAGERRAAPHVFMQIAACERAALRLWLLRFGEAEQGGAS